MKKSVVVIGSGISSLTSAILLLKAGYKVTVLERHYRPGGYMHCFNRFGHRFETGGHYLGALGEGLPFRRLLEHMDVHHPEDFVALRPDQVDLYNFGDWEFAYPVGHAETIAKLAQEFPRQAPALKKYFELVRESANSFPTYNFKSNYDQSQVLKFLGVSLSRVLDDLGIEGRARLLLNAPCILHGVAPRDVPFGIHSIMVDSLVSSAHGLSAGGDRLAGRFVDKIKQLGGEIHLRHEVAKVDVRDNQIQNLVCANGASFQAESYISGIHPKLLFGMIDKEQIRPAFWNRLQLAKESTAFMGAYLVLDRPHGIDPLSNYYVVRDEDLHQPNSRFAFFSSAQRHYSGSGPMPLCIHTSCPPDFLQKASSGKDYESAKEAVFAPLFSSMEEIFPGLRSSISDICYSSPQTNMKFNPSPTGSAYGLYHDFSVTGARALGPRTHIQNLYLTGQNTLFPGLLGAAVSGLRTSGFFTGIKDILKQLEIN